MNLLFGYTGKALDEVTGLQNNLHRWYDAQTGQWMSEDPIGFAGGDENLRRYVGNHPTYARDPTGLEEPYESNQPTDALIESMFQHGGTFTARRYQWYGDHRGIKGDIIYGHFQIAIYDEIADQLENLMWELVGAGCGIAGGAAVEAIQTGWGYWRKTQYAVKNGEKLVQIPTAIVEDVRKTFKQTNGREPTPEELKSALQAIWDEGVKRVNSSFESFAKLKKALGSAGDGKVWHHIVEQSKIGEFGAQAIHCRRNVVAVTKEVNEKINGYYSSKQPFTGGKTVREWLKGKSLEEQYEFGMEVLERFTK